MDMESKTAAPGEQGGGETVYSDGKTNATIVPQPKGEGQPDVDRTRSRAREYLRRGWCPIAYAHHTKRPLAKDWQKRTPDKVDVDRDFNGDRTNIGVLLGSPSGDLVDVDLDCPEAVRLSGILPPTPLRFGRRSNPDSHRLYRTEIPATLQWQVGPLGMIVELRSTGGQTMFPGSVHPEGEAVEWSGDPTAEPREIEAELLIEKCRLLAFASLILHFWADGRRNQLALRVAGTCLDHGWSVKDIYELLAGISTVAGDKQFEMIKGCIANTEKRRSADRPYVGLPKLCESLGVEADQIRSWFDRRPPEEAGVLVSSEPIYVARQFSKSLDVTWHWRGDFYRWTGAWWTATDKEQLCGFLYPWLENIKVVNSAGKPTRFQATQTAVGNVIAALAGVRQLDNNHETPFWIDPHSDDGAPVDLLPFRNGVLNLETFELGKPDPRLFALHRVDCDYDPQAKAPIWDAFMQQVFPDDPESVDCVEEVCGLCLTDDTSFQKTFAMIGQSRSGKGTIGRIIRAAIGPERYANPTMSLFSGTFGRQNLIGKAVAVIADARGQSRYDPHAAVESILSITGEDAQSIPRKYKSDWNGTLPTRLILMSNVIPKLTDPSGVIISRFIALHFQQSFLGKENRNLTRDLLAELPGIMNRWLAGLRRLRERGYFLQPESGKEILAQMDDNTGPVRAFVEEQCEINPRHEIDTQSLYRMFKIWLQEHGHPPMTSATFGRDLFALGKNIKKGRAKQIDPKTGKSVNGPTTYVGITHVECVTDEVLSPEVQAMYEARAIDKITGDHYDEVSFS